MAKPLEDRRSIMAALMEALVLGGPIAAPAVGKAGAKAADGPKKEANWWIKAAVAVGNMLKEQIAEDNAARAEAGQSKVAGTIGPKVASMLKKSGQLTKDTMPSLEEVLAVYEEYKADPDAASAASKGSSTASKKTKFSELSEEEKKARRSEAAKKAAATRKANKAAKEAAEAGEGADGGSVGKAVAEVDSLIAAAKKPAPKAAPKPAAPKQTEDTMEDGRDIWLIGGKRYARIEEGLWHAATGKWAGTLNEDGTIDTEAEEIPFSAAEDDE